jgi:hypothetical protein
MNKKPQPIAIRPFLAETPNMGLEKYSMVIHEGTAQIEDLACIEENGVPRYVSGLNEFAPDVKNIKDPEHRKAVIEDIRKTVAQLERELAANEIEPDDKEFWNKVKILRPDNHSFWSKVNIACTNEPVYLDPTKAMDLIKIRAIEAGGFTIVAKSYEDAKTAYRAPKFYLDKNQETVSTKTQLKKLRNTALAKLSELFKTNPDKLFYIAKVLDPMSHAYRRSTPIDNIYDAMDTFIMGESTERNKRLAASNFIETADGDMEDLAIRAMIRDASFYKIIGPKPDGMLYHLPSSTMLGRNVSDVKEYLRNPMNADVLDKIKSKIDQYWNE